MRTIIKSIFVFTLLCASCNQRGEETCKLFATPIEDLISHPEKYEGRSIVISGEVTHSGGIGKKTAFKIDDGTASIWVLDKASAPAVGEDVRIRGHVEQWVRLGNKTITVFYASER